MPATEETLLTSRDPLTVQILLFDGFDLLDALGPYEVFQAAKMFLNAIPGSYEGVRQLLGHALASSATRMYCDTEDQAATEMFDKILETERAALGVKKRQKRRRPKTKISKKQIRKAS